MASIRRIFRQQLNTAIMAGALALPLLAQAAPAQADYPSQPIKLIVPFAAGGGNDAIARALGKQLAESLGQPVVVENQPGAGGKIGVESGLRAEPDGRSEEHTSELQSPMRISYAILCWKKKKTQQLRTLTNP